MDRQVLRVEQLSLLMDMSREHTGWNAMPQGALQDLRARVKL